MTWNLSGVAPKRDWSSKRVKNTQDRDFYRRLLDACLDMKGLIRRFGKVSSHRSTRANFLQPKDRDLIPCLIARYIHG